MLAPMRGRVKNWGAASWRSSNHPGLQRPGTTRSDNRRPESRSGLLHAVLEWNQREREPRCHGYLFRSDDHAGVSEYKKDSDAEV